jgi:hypothetical protein
MKEHGIKLVGARNKLNYLHKYFHMMTGKLLGYKIILTKKDIVG